jgi:hypothetical protein
MNNQKFVKVKVLEGEHEEWLDQVVLKAGKRSNEDDLEILKSYFEDRGWNGDISGFGTISSPEYDGKYYYLPDWLDKTIIPEEGLRRLKAVEELGIEFQGVIIGHEVKKPKFGNIVEVDWFELDRRARETAVKTKEAAVKSAKTTLKVLGGLMVGLAYLTGGILSLAVAVVPALLADPMLIIVLNDSENTNVEIYWWRD